MGDMRRLIPFLLTTLALAACAPMPVGNPKVPEPARAVELSRYVGTWRELARYENRFERGCGDVTATYAARPDGRISVVNVCVKDGRVTKAKGVATRVGDAKSAKLKVSFFGPFSGDYWVLDHADDYSWSIVGEPSGRYLWVLTREARPPQAVRLALLDRLKAMGYDTAMLHFTDQRP